jgi:hypothetical protein
MKKGIVPEALVPTAVSLFPLMDIAICETIEFVTVDVAVHVVPKSVLR